MQDLDWYATVAKPLARVVRDWESLSDGDKMDVVGAALDAADRGVRSFTVRAELTKSGRPELVRLPRDIPMRLPASRVGAA